MVPVAIDATRVVGTADDVDVSDATDAVFAVVVAAAAVLWPVVGVTEFGVAAVVVIVAADKQQQKQRTFVYCCSICLKSHMLLSAKLSLYENKTGS